MSALEEEARAETVHTEPANTKRTQDSCLRYLKLCLLDLDELFMTSYDFTTGPCVLYSLPLHLIHEITRSLDLRSQRNLFMCSSQLYSKWQLQVPDHTDWQVVERSINLLDEGLCQLNSYIRISFAPDKPENPWFQVTCQRQDQSMLFSITECYSANRMRHGTSEVIWSGMTKDQLWHRLASAPDVHSASMEHVSALMARVERLIEEAIAGKRGMICRC